jgi:hypothetical protein
MMSRKSGRFFVLWTAAKYAELRPDVSTWGLPSGELMCCFSRKFSAEGFALAAGGRVVSLMRVKDVGPLLVVEGGATMLTARKDDGIDLQS